MLALATQPDTIAMEGTDDGLAVKPPANRQVGPTVRTDRVERADAPFAAHQHDAPGADRRGGQILGQIAFKADLIPAVAVHGHSPGLID